MSYDSCQVFLSPQFSPLCTELIQSFCICAEVVDLVTHTCIKGSLTDANTIFMLNSSHLWS